MSTRVGPYSRQQPRVSYSLGMRLKKAVTNLIQEEVLSIYALPKRDSGIDTTTKEEATKMRVEKVRFDGRSTV